MDDKCPDCGMEFEMVVEGKIPGDLRERQDHPGGVRCLSRQLAAYRATEDHLPDLCGMGDDMTVAFALQLSALEAQLAAAKAERDALQARIARLLQALADRAILAEYDCPGDAPEICGWQCEICGALGAEPSDLDHAPTCLFAAAGPYLNHHPSCRRECLDSRDWRHCTCGFDAFCERRDRTLNP